jgi:prenylcysteine oxidase/farnesylcysteine lyase
MKPLELGASIFVRANKNLWRASDEFNLTRIDFEDEESNMGIWDGQEFLFTVRPPSITHRLD